MENKLAEYPDTHTVSTTVLRMTKELKTIGKTEIGTSYYQTLTVKVCPERCHKSSRLTYMEWNLT